MSDALLKIEHLTRYFDVSKPWLNRVLEPVYPPIRRVLPDTSPLELAPLVAFNAVISLRDFILPAILLG